MKNLKKSTNETLYTFVKEHSENGHTSMNSLDCYTLMEMIRANIALEEMKKSGMKNHDVTIIKGITKRADMNYAFGMWHPYTDGSGTEYKCLLDGYRIIGTTGSFPGIEEAPDHQKFHIKQIIPDNWDNVIGIELNRADIEVFKKTHKPRKHETQMPYMIQYTDIRHAGTKTTPIQIYLAINPHYLADALDWTGSVYLYVPTADSGVLAVHGEADNLIYNVKTPLMAVSEDGSKFALVLPVNPKSDMTESGSVKVDYVVKQ